MIGMAALLAGAGSGYIQGQQRQREQDRQDQFDRIQREEADARKEARDLETAKRNRLIDAYAPVGMTDVMTKPEEADNRDVGTPGTELVNTGTKRVGQQTFGPDQTKEAEAAVAAANTPEARTDRASRALLSMGDVAGAQQLRTGAKAEKLSELQLRQAIEKARDEGNNRAMQMVLDGRSPQEVMDAYNASGDVKLADLKYEPITVEHPVLGKVKSAKLSGVIADGRRFEVPDVQAHLFNTFQLEKRLGMLADARKGDADRAQRQPLVDSQVAENNARAGYYQAGGSGAGKAAPVERMDEPDKAALKVIESSRSAIQRRLAKIEDTIIEAQADPMVPWDEKSPRATMLQQQLRQQQEALGALQIRERGIFQKYQGAPAADPYGMPRGGAAAAPGAPGTRAGEMIPPHVQAKRDVEAGQQMVLSEFGGDLRRARADLLQIEQGIKSAPNTEARAELAGRAKRLRAGIESMERPMGAPAPAAAAPAAMAPAASAAVPRGMVGMTGVAAPAGPASAPLGMSDLPARGAGSVGVPAPASQSRGTPAGIRLEQAGQVLDQARARVAAATMALQSFGSRQRAADPGAFEAARAALSAARAELSQAEAAYASHVPANPAAFVYPAP